MNSQSQRHCTDHMIRVIPFQKLTLHVPYYESVVAGFPSPVDDYTEESLDVGAYLVKNPAATFFVKVSGYSMIDAGIHPNDILVVDRSLSASHNSIIVAVVNGEFTVKKLYKQGKVIKLIPQNSSFAPIVIEEGDEFIVWGVVAHVLHRTT